VSTVPPLWISVLPRLKETSSSATFFNSMPRPCSPAGSDVRLLPTAFPKSNPFLIRHDNGYFIAGAAAAADVYRVLEFLIAACDDISQSFAEPRPEVAFCSLNTLRSFNQPHQAVRGRRAGLNLARHPGVDFQDARMGAFS